MVGKMVKLKCRVVLDHLKIKKPEVPDTSAAESPQQDHRLASDTDDSSSYARGSGGLDTVDATQASASSSTKLAKNENCDSSLNRAKEPLQKPYNPKAVFSHWKAKGRGIPGGILERKKVPNTTLDMKFLIENGIPSPFEVIEPWEAEQDSVTPSADKLQLPGQPCTKKSKIENLKETPVKSYPSEIGGRRLLVSSDEPDTASITFENTSFIFSGQTPFSPPTSIPPRPKPDRRGLDVADIAYFHCVQSDVVEKEEEKETDITGSILELEQDEISTPKGARKGKLAPSPDFPKNPDWIKPEILLDDIWSKKQSLRLEADVDTDFLFPSDDSVMNASVWQIPELMALKEKLNETKSLLDNFPLEEWHQHTKRMNIFQLIMNYVKRYFNPEFSSQAWGKMFEILCVFEVIPNIVVEPAELFAEGDEIIPFDSVHLCEAPGAFISALNHFIKISYPGIDWNWLATTLNPYHEANDVGKMINDDRLILMSLDKWTFLDDNTGNILKTDNLTHLLKEQETKLNLPREMKTGSKGNRVFLVTADGSVDCQSNPAEQERIVAHLHFGEIITALMLLQTDGSFVLKIFTFLESSTICHLYLLSCVFKEVHLYKPATSKEGNSEVYVVCLRFLGKKPLSKILKSKLIDNIETYGERIENGKLLLPRSAIPKFFIDRIHTAAEFFCNYQISVIRRNVSCFPCDTRMYHVMKPFRKEVAEQWIEYCGLEALHSKYRLFNFDSDEVHRRANNATHVDERAERGCFADKLIRLSGNHMQKIDYIKDDLLSVRLWTTPQNQALFGGSFKIGNVVHEKKYTNIRCSRFCLGRLLSNRQELREIIQSYRKELDDDGLSTMENICTGHSIKRVHESMAKSCDVVLTNLEHICFMKMTWDFIVRTDYADQKYDLRRVFDAVKDMEKERSMFLCRFPMLTRLQTGLIFCFTGVFEKILIYADPGRKVIGIMLHKFKGLVHPEQKKLFQAIEDILAIHGDDEFNHPVLEFVPMKILLKFMPADFLVNYNSLLITQDMLRKINVVQGVVAGRMQVN